MDVGTAALLGRLFGLLLAAIPAYFLGLFAGLAFRSKEPDERAIYAAAVSWILMYFISGWGLADGGPFRFDAGLLYIPAATIAFFLLRSRYRRDSPER